MKKVRLMVILLLASSLLIPMTFARGSRGGDNAGCGAGAMIADLPYQEVDADEQGDLTYMREEEKLARDVYRALDDLWGLRVFRNISQAEQRHMDAIARLLVKYGIEDPVGDNPDGQFENEELQELFHQLVAQGSESLNEALIVGATIEDLDLHDLATDLARTDNEDIQTVYQNLAKGSRNHLRAFNSLLVGNGVTYTPQFISQVEFDEITSSAKEQGAVDANGDPISNEDCARQNPHRRSPRNQRRW